MQKTLKRMARCVPQKYTRHGYRLAAVLCAFLALALCACGAVAPGGTSGTADAPSADVSAETEGPLQAPPLETMAPNAPGAPDEIEDFYFSYGAASGGYVFTVWREEDGTGCVSAAGTNGNTLELMGTVDLSVFERLQEIIEANGIAAWDGFSAGDSDAAETSEHFSLSVTYGDGGAIEAAGSAQFPEGYEQGAKALADYLESLAS